MIGDHIRTLKAGHWTHAIDCGDETVIGLADDGLQPRVRRSYRPEFVAGSESVEIVRHRERTFPAEEVVARAYSRFSDPALASMFRDSAAFAEWCTTGRLPAAQPIVAISVPGVAAAPAPAPSAPAAKPAPRAAAKKKPAGKAKPAARAKAARKAKPAARAKAARKAKPPRKAAKAPGRGARGKPAKRGRRTRR